MIYIYIFLIDLILGGAGRYLVIGSISARMIIYAVGLCIIVFKLFKYKTIIWEKKGVILNKKSTWIIIMLYLSIIFSLSIGIIRGNNLNLALDKFLSYSFYFLLPVFLLEIKTTLKAENIMFFINKLIFLLTIIQVTIFIIFSISPNMVYEYLNPILINNQFGLLDLINESTFRVFLKTSIFIPFGLFYMILNILNNKIKIKFRYICKIIIYSLAIYSTRTMGIWIITIVGMVIIGIMYIKVNLRNLKKYSILFVAMIYCAYKFGIIQTLIERLNLSDPSTSFKAQQLNELIKTGCQKFFFGNGYGQIITVKTESLTRTSDNWEIMWAELFVNSGFIGILISLVFIGYIIFYSYKLRNKFNKSIMDLIFISTICLIIVNLSNPFLNNPIGIGYVMIMFSMVDVFVTERNVIKYE